MLIFTTTITMGGIRNLRVLASHMRYLWVWGSYGYPRGLLAVEVDKGCISRLGNRSVDPLTV